uniref:PAZ domain-containing protein n=1 Tax=Phytophthora ramorum TaxID=164328 RepID=H3H7I2_PHYRM
MVMQQFTNGANVSRLRIKLNKDVDKVGRCGTLGSPTEKNSWVTKMRIRSKKTLGLWFGSLRATQIHLVVNLDLSVTAFVEAMDAIDFLCETLALRNMSTSVAKYQHSTFSKAIRDVKVNMIHRPGVKRSYRVNGLSRESADNTFFGDDEGQRMSIAQYFQQTYKIRLRYQKLSCLQRNYLPMEVCHVMAGQTCLHNVTDTQVANMIRLTCTPPGDRSSTSSARLTSTRTRSPKASTGCAVKAATSTIKSLAQIVWMINPIADARSYGTVN